jgi:CBS-domain-containing membrane protein
VPDHAEQTAADVMVTIPKTVSPGVTVRQVRAEFDNDHVHMLLLTKDGKLEGTIVRSDIPHEALPSMPAFPLSRLRGRVVTPATPVSTLLRRLGHLGLRRLAVVDAGGLLLGLVCLKQSGTGFCSDDGILARRQEAEPSQPAVPSTNP